MNDKEKQEVEEKLNSFRKLQVAEINERKKQKAEKVNFKKDLLEINNESKKEKKELTKSKTNNTSLKCNLL